MPESYLFQASDDKLAKDLRGWADVSVEPVEEQSRDLLTGELRKRLKYVAVGKPKGKASVDVELERYPHMSVFNFSPASLVRQLAGREANLFEQAELDKPFKIGPEGEWIRVIRLPEWFVQMLADANESEVDSSIRDFAHETVDRDLSLFLYQSVL